MIEVYDIKDPEKLDITPELAIAAYNTLIQFCRNQPAGSGEDGTCGRCILYNYCPSENDLLPEDWPELHFPRLTGNTVEHLKDGKVHKITHSNREEAEKTFSELNEEIEMWTYEKDISYVRMERWDELP